MEDYNDPAIVVFVKVNGSTGDVVMDGLAVFEAVEEGFSITSAIIEARYNLINSDQHQFIWCVKGRAHRFAFGARVPAGVQPEFAVTPDGLFALAGAA